MKKYWIILSCFILLGVSIYSTVNIVTKNSKSELEIVGYSFLIFIILGKWMKIDEFKTKNLTNIYFYSMKGLISLGIILISLSFLDFVFKIGLGLGHYVLILPFTIGVWMLFIKYLRAVLGSQKGQSNGVRKES